MESEEIRERIQVRVSQGDFLANMLHVARFKSDTTQSEFVGKLSKIAAAVRSLLEDNGLVCQLKYNPRSYWPSCRGKAYSFVDGGVAHIDLPSAAPVGIRVGSYTVLPGDETEERERFNIELALVDDLFSQTGFIYEDDLIDLSKLRDAARMISELAAAYRLAKGIGQRKLDAVIIHGPLVNPVSPYGLNDFPSFGLEACRTFLDDDAWDGDERDRQFVSIYLEVLERLKEVGTPIVGAVERSIGRDPVFLRRILDRLHADGALKERDARALETEVQTYGLNDSSLLDVVLREGEFVAPIPVMRQGPENKWPEDWKRKIGSYPHALTTYLKPSENVMPFRLEGFEEDPAFNEVVELIFNTSRLLPSYGFPVGLDIVDRFAKVPAWLTRGVKGQHQVVLLQKAMETGDARTIAFAKRVLAAKGRDWLFRPDV
jgi:hypothetical protein